MNGMVRQELKCCRCLYVWTPRKDKEPDRCPKCRSIKWNVSSLAVTCLRCGHSWNSHNGSPKRCPVCGTHNWNEPPIVHECKRCGNQWRSKTTRMPKRCPACSSKDWFSDVKEVKSVRKRGFVVDGLLRERILDMHSKRMDLTAISIETGTPYSIVRDVIQSAKRERLSLEARP